MSVQGDAGELKEEAQVLQGHTQCSPGWEEDTGGGGFQAFPFHMEAALYFWRQLLP